MSVPGVPYHTGGGVAESSWEVLTELRKRGHQALVLTDHEKPYPAAVAAVQAAGAEHQAVPDAETRHRIAAEWKPDAMYCLSLNNLLPPMVVPGVPRMCVVGDLEHMVPVFRRQYYSRAMPLGYAEISQLHQQGMRIKAHTLPALRECRTVVASCYHHSQWLTSQDVPNTYIPAPGADPMGKGWVRSRDTYPTNPTPRISMVGHLQGIATLSGLYFLAEDVMPWLLSDLGVECDVRIAGGERLYVDLATRLMPYLTESGGPVQLLGYVEDITAEMMAAEVALVSTPIDLGVRTRIIDAMALGCCLVVHKANLAGFEAGELLPGQNCLVGTTGRELAEHVARACKDPDMRVRLGDAARRTFDQYHADSGAKTVDLIEQMVNKPEAKAPSIPTAAPTVKPAGAPPTFVMKPGKDMVSRPGAKPETDPERYIPDLMVPFHGDKVLLAVVDDLVRVQELKLFVETGTEVGAAVLHVANTWPEVRCYTCEAHLPTMKRAQENLKEHRGQVSIFAGKSQDFFERFANQMPDMMERRALFWLDAHSHGFGCDLPAEVAFVTRSWSGGYILIDDFQVPGHPDFQFDVYKTGALCWDLIRDSLERVNNVWWPDYPAPPAPLGRGWVLLVFGDAPDWSPSAEGPLAGKMRPAPELVASKPPIGITL